MAIYRRNTFAALEVVIVATIQDIYSAGFTSGVLKWCGRPGSPVRLKMDSLKVRTELSDNEIESFMRT